MSVRVGLTFVRVVCWNTLAAAHSSKTSNLIRIKHSADVVKNVYQVREIVDLATQELRATVEQYKTLANRGINAVDLKKYVKLVLIGDIEDNKLSTKAKNIITTAVKLFEIGKGANIAGRNWWGSYNAVTEFLSYNAGRNVDSRLNSLWFGENSKVNSKALELALALSA